MATRFEGKTPAELRKIKKIEKEGLIRETGVECGCSSYRPLIIARDTYEFGARGKAPREWVRTILCPDCGKLYDERVIIQRMRRSNKKLPPLPTEKL